MTALDPFCVRRWPPTSGSRLLSPLAAMRKLEPLPCGWLMKITMRTTYAGPLGNCGPGGTLDVPEKDAVTLVGAGYADYAGPVDGEKADAPVLETPEKVDIVGRDGVEVADIGRKNKAPRKRK